MLVAAEGEAGDARHLISANQEETALHKAADIIVPLRTFCERFLSRYATAMLHLHLAA